jgi:MerR family transcriptional regulator, light-induced transcriptional regulator
MQLQQAADVLGVHYQTAYAWVRDGRLPARKVGRGYEVGEEDVQALVAARNLGAEPRRELRVRDWPEQADGLHRAIVTGEETYARKWIGRLADGIAVVDLCERVIAPALRRIGEEWASGQVSIAEEHRASAICERLIAAHAHQPAGRPRGTAVVATPPGERHGLPALMAAACLREDHWIVHHLGPDLPLAEALGLAGRAQASLVVFSCTTVGIGSDEATGLRAAPGQTAGAGAAGPAILVGRPGDSLTRLVELARESQVARSPASTRPPG